MNEKKSYDVRNRDNTIISYHSKVQRRERSADTADTEDTADTADTEESMDRRKSIKKMQGRNHGFFFVRQSQWVGLICPHWLR